MKDFNVRDIKNLVEPRQAGKTAPKTTVGNQEFIKTLESAVNQMQEAADGAKVTAEKVDASSIKKQVNAANENYAKIMKAGQLVSQLYHNLNSQKTEE